MATKKTSRAVRLYVEAHQRAYAWADKAMVYRHAGKIAQATAATQKARHWLRKIKLLQAQTAPSVKQAKL